MPMAMKMMRVVVLAGLLAVAAIVTGEEPGQAQDNMYVGLRERRRVRER